MAIEVYIFLVILTSVSSNPVLKYSFCPFSNPRCEATIYASNNAPFKFDNISTGIYYFDPNQLVPPLSVSCTYNEPLHWILTAKQDVRVNAISSNVTTNGSHQQYQYNINFNEASLGLIRCESYEDADRAAQIYIAALDSKLSVQELLKMVQIFSTFVPPGNKIEAIINANDIHVTSDTLKGLSCTVPQQGMEQDLLFQMLPCSTIFECETQLETVEAQTIFRACNHEIVNSSEPISKLSPSSYGRIIKNPVTSGVVTCAASYRHDVGYIWNLEYFFTGVDSKIHFVSDDLPPKAAISLKMLKQTNFSQSSKEFKIQVECTIAAFIVFPNFELFREYSNGTIDKIDFDPSFGKPEDSAPKQPYLASQRLLIQLKSKNEDPIVAVRCRARSRNSIKPVEAILTMESIQRELYDEFLMSEADTTSPPFFLVALPILTCVTLISGMVAFALFTLWRERKAKKWRQLTVEETNAFLNGNATIPATAQNNQVNIDAMSFPKSYQIIAPDLKLNNHEVLGEGQFGRCVKGQFRNVQVAVKTLKASSDVNTFKEFLREVKIMAYLGQHENIVQFMGAVVTQLRERENDVGVCLAVVELSPFGDLLNYIRKNDPENSSKGNQCTDTTKPYTNPTNTLMSFCEQIAAGMEFLVHKNVIHGDLAARNVLVFPDNVVKITDFGLSRKLYTASNYKKKNDTPLPWAWMAMESLKYMEFSPMTDMWSFGVTVWEIFTLGQVPFAGFNYSCDFVDEIVGGLRLQCPKLAQDEIYEFMMLTWDPNPAVRPSFEDAKLFFRQHTSGSAKMCTSAVQNSYVVCK